MTASSNDDPMTDGRHGAARGAFGRVQPPSQNRSTDLDQSGRKPADRRRDPHRTRRNGAAFVLQSETASRPQPKPLPGPGQRAVHEIHTKATAARAVLPQLEVTIEIPRGSFRKVGSTGRLDFLSPIPCPFNYGSVRTLLGLEGDLLDAVVLGPRLAPGTRVRVLAHGAVGLHDRGLYDDKLICSSRPLSPAQLRRVRRLMLAFFRIYGYAKRLLNTWRGRPGRTGLHGWVASADALARARPAALGIWEGPPVPF